MDSEQSDLGPHCLLVCKNRFEKFAKIFSRRRKQTTFSDADFLGVLRVRNYLEHDLLLVWQMLVWFSIDSKRHCSASDTHYMPFNLLTFAIFLANSAGDKLIFFLFSEKTGFDISLETICMKCKNLFYGKN